MIEFLFGQFDLDTKETWVETTILNFFGFFGQEDNIIKFEVVVTYIRHYKIDDGDYDDRRIMYGI